MSSRSIWHEIEYRGVVYQTVSDCVRAVYKNADARLIGKALYRLKHGWPVIKAISTLEEKHTGKRVYRRGKSPLSKIVVDGRRRVLKDVLKENGIANREFRKRVARGWSVQDAATAPNGTRRLRPHNRDVNVTINGETLCLSDWARRNGLKPSTVQARMRSGWSERESVETPSTRLLGYQLHPIQPGVVTRTAKAVGLNPALVKKRMNLGESLVQAISYPPRNAHERNLDREVDAKRRELASLGIVI